MITDAYKQGSCILNKHFESKVKIRPDIGGMLQHSPSSAIYVLLVWSTCTGRKMKPTAGLYAAKLPQLTFLQLIC